MRWLTLALLLGAAANLTHEHFLDIDRPYVHDRMMLHQQIIAGTAAAPYRYRVLVPAVMEAAMRPLARVLSPTRAFVLVYAAYAASAITLLLVTLYGYCRCWYSPEWSLVGVLFVAATMPVVFAHQYFQPWSLLEPSLFALGLWCLVRGWLGTFALVVALASLTRETAVYLPLAYLLGVGRPRGHHVARFLALVAIWAGIFLGLRYALGPAPVVVSAAEAWQMNTTVEDLRRTGVNVGLGVGVLSLLAAYGLPQASAFVRRTAWLVPLYLAALIPFALWWEVRLWMTLYPMLLPLALAGLTAPEVRREETADGREQEQDHLDSDQRH